MNSFFALLHSCSQLRWDVFFFIRWQQYTWWEGADYVCIHEMRHQRMQKTTKKIRTNLTKLELNSNRNDSTTTYPNGRFFRWVTRKDRESSCTVAAGEWRMTFRVVMKNVAFL